MSRSRINRATSNEGVAAMAVESVTALVPTASGEAPTKVASHPDRGPRLNKSKSDSTNSALMVRLWWLTLTAVWLLGSMFAVTLATRGPDGSFAVGSPEIGADLGWLTPVLFPESAALAWQQSLPSAQVFALAFWLVPVLILALLPAALVEFRVTFPVALAATALVVVTPLFASGSLQSLNAVLPAVFTVSMWAYASRTTRRWTALVLAVLAGIALARLPWSEPAMAVPVGVALVLIALSYLLTSRARFVRLLWVVPASAAVAVGLWALVARSQSQSLVGLLESVQGTGSAGVTAATNVGLPRGFGAPFEVLVAEGSTADTALAGELKGSWTFLAVVVAALFFGYLVRGNWPERLRAVVVTAVAAAGFAWFLLDRPDVTAGQIPLLELADPYRVAAVWGTVVVVAVAVLFGAPRHWVFSVGAGVGMAALLALTAQRIQTNLLPEFDMVSAAIVAAVATVGAFLMCRKRPGTQYLGVLVLVTGAVVVVWPMVAFQVS
jgi:hypothetical protein